MTPRKAWYLTVEDNSIVLYTCVKGDQDAKLRQPRSGLELGAVLEVRLHEGCKLKVCYRVILQTKLLE